MRLVAAFFVVCLHTTDHAFGDNQTACTLLDAFSRFAVPFFFVITGYYFDRIKIDKYVLKIIKLIFVAVLIYLPISYLFKPSSLQLPNSTYNVILCLLFNAFPLAATYHLWFLLALIYGVLFMKPIVKITNSRQQILVIIVLLLANVIISYYLSPNYIRSVWFLGLPYMLMGYLLSQTEINKITPSCMVLMSIITVSSCLIGIEALYTEKAKEHFIFTPVLVMAIFFFCFRYNFKNEVLAQIAKKGSSFIYIYHLAVYRVLDFYLDASWYNDLCPIIVFLFTLGVFIIYSNVNQMFKRNKQEL